MGFFVSQRGLPVVWAPFRHPHLPQTQSQAGVPPTPLTPNPQVSAISNHTFCFLRISGLFVAISIGNAVSHRPS